MLPSPADLKYFLEAAHTENVSRAAERLGISQPTLSLSIQRLEQALGTPLFLRGKSGVKLTKAGTKLVSQTRTLLGDWKKIVNDAKKDETEISGRYILGCHPSVALYTLPEFLPALLKQYPRLEIQFAHDLSRKITDDVIGFKIDFGIVVNPVKHPDLVIRPLLKDEVSLWTRATGSDPDVLICDPDLLQTQSILKQLSRRDLSFSRTLTSSNLEVIASLVEQGCGVGILPGRVAKRVANGKLKLFDKSSPSIQDVICLVFRADAQKSKASRSITQRIESAFSHS